MKEYTQDSTDIKTLIGQQVYSGHYHQEQERELLEAASCDSEHLTCFLCNLEIKPDQTVNLHHPTYKSRGGTETLPVHERCHVEYHSRQGDFREWGRQSAQTRRWAFNLKNVKTHPAYDFDRAYYSMLYAK